MIKLQCRFLFSALVNHLLLPCIAATLCCAPAVLAAEPVKIREGILFEKNVQIPTRDGAFVMANVFRPTGNARHPVLISASVYGKDLHTRDKNPEGWEKMVAEIEGLCDQSSCEYHNHETPDPEVWVPDGYVVIRVDLRGSGKSPGRLDPFSPRDNRDIYDAIEWAGTQPWSNGKVGMAGISYFAMVQWAVAADHPPHLAAIAPWEGASDLYRDAFRQGGILSNLFLRVWTERGVYNAQHGNGDSSFRDMDDGGPLGGQTSLSEEELVANRVDLLPAALSQSLDTDYYRERRAVLEDIRVPLLSAANWGGFGLHARGNFNGFREAGSSQKWLEVHTGNHIYPFYEARGHAIMKQFFDHFLKGIENGWSQRPPVLLNIRHANGTNSWREEYEWPLARTEWRKLHLDASSSSLARVIPPSPDEAIYDALDDAVVFRSPPLEETLELTGPMAAKLFVSSSTEDMDLFVTVQAFTPDGSEVTFQGANDPSAPIAQGWLRASHRKLDPEKSHPWQPYHAHNERQKLTPEQVYEVDVEIWPGQVVLPPGSVLSLRIEGKDFARPRSGLSGWLRDRVMEFLSLNVGVGSGPFLHNHPDDRPSDVFGGQNSIHTGGPYPSHLLLPVIPTTRVTGQAQ